ncbi:MAG: inositol monophosphatase [Verrucomicrobia bacterium]|nr:inositol monophosphatase [Verrucomicrobiota bacterium]
MLNAKQFPHALATAVRAARAVGVLLRRHQNGPKKINSEVQHDIKLELDVRSQKLIERILRRAFPTIPVLGEEGILGDPNAATRWVVDPIDGTVNFTHGIPHVCISIALQVRAPKSAKRTMGGYITVVGVIYDPFCDELWTAVRGQPARLNGRITRVSRRSKLAMSILAMGFAKHSHTLNKMLPVFDAMIHRVRKIRLMGAAALAMTYVASGRFDIYTEYGLRLWDIAAGVLIIECAGGEAWFAPLDEEYTYHLNVNNGLLREKFDRAARV